MAVGALWQSVFAVGVIAALLVLFRKRFDAPWAGFLSANAYGVYVLHPLVLVGLGLLLAPVAAPAGLAFLLVAAAGIALSWVAAGLVRAVPGVDRVL